MFLKTKVFTLALLLGSVIYMTPGLLARALDWGGSLNADNVESDQETPLNESYVFYLGHFSSFTPTAENTDQWSANWATVDAVNYKPTYGLFNGRHQISDSDPAGQQGYIWGVRRSRDYMEWILITDPSWIWPTNDPLGQKLNWMVGSATVAILGDINDGSYQMKTAPVSELSPIPIISYELWAKRFFADNDPNADPDADPNSNSRTNLEEFALDANPVHGQGGEFIRPSVYKSPSEQGLPAIDQGNYLGVILQPSLDADVEIVGWVSPDITFNENVSAAIIEELPDGSLLIRDTEPMGPSNTRKFIRIEFNEPS